MVPTRCLDGLYIAPPSELPGGLKNDKQSPRKSERRWPFPCTVVIFRPDKRGLNAY